MSGQILLLVYPEPGIRARLASALGDAGYRVMSAATSEEAWQRAEEVLQPDAVVAYLGEHEEVDRGWIGGRLRDQANSRDVPVVALAADRRRALRSGFVNVAALPADPEEVVLLTRLALDRRQKERGLAGDLEKMSIPDLLQTVAAGARSGRIAVEDDKRSGTLWLRDGRVIHATINGGASGREAAFELITWTSGSFAVDFGPVTSPETISDSTPFLLLEAMRLRDEAERLRPPDHAGLPDEPPIPTREQLAVHLGLLLLNVAASWISDRLRVEILAERLETERRRLCDRYPILERFEVDGLGARIGYRGDAPAPATADVEPLIGSVSEWLRRLFADIERALPGRYSLARLAVLTEAHQANLEEVGFAEGLGWASEPDKGTP